MKLIVFVREREICRDGEIDRRTQNERQKNGKGCARGREREDMDGAKIIIKQE